MRHGLFSCLVASSLALGACAHERPKTALGPPPRLPEQRRAPRPPPPADWFWEPVEADVRDEAKKIELPAGEAMIVRVEDGARIWDALGEEGRARLGRDGVVVLGSDAPPEKGAARHQIGAFYTDLREARTPYVVTLDALFFAVHVGLERALAEVEALRLAPEVKSLVERLAARLAAEERGAGVETANGLRVARGIFAVAGALLDRAAKLDPELAPTVTRELALIDAHAGPAPSPLLGATIDYAELAPDPGASRPEAQAALAWLGAAPLVLVGLGEVPGAAVDVGVARTHARAAMILARLVERELEPGTPSPTGESSEHITRLLAFAWGRSDDVSLREVSEVASSLSLSLSSPESVASVVKVDRVRRLASRLRVPLVFDGLGAPGRAGASVRIFGGAAPPDSAALASLASPLHLPRPLELAVWLGATEARAATKEESVKVPDEVLDASLARVGPPDEDAMHASVHGSILAAIRASLRAPRATPAADRVAIESALAAWTWLRHDGRPLSRSKPRTAASKELRVAGAPLPAFVEPAPEVIARLVGAVRQLERGLAKRGPLEPTSPAMTTLAEIEDLLRASLAIAEHEVNDEPLSATDLAALASLPARLASLEEQGPDGEPPALVPVAAEVAVDLAKGVVASATGLVEPVVTLVREPHTGRVVLAVGAHVAQHDLDARTSDAALRARLASGTLPHGAYVSAFRVVAPK